MPAVKVAVLDGEFDLNHASGNLVFGFPQRNVMDDNDQVGALEGHAHGTLCAGIIGAQPGIDGWPVGGVEPSATMIPIAIYRTTEPVRAELGHLIEGIDIAAAEGCEVISISVGGFPPANALISAVARAARGAVIVAGTGNRRSGRYDRADFVLYPAKFENVVGVGAAIVGGTDPSAPLHRVSLDLTTPPNEPVRWESRYGSGLDVVAPGLGVTSTDISGPSGASNDPSPTGDIWDRFSGTSAATPLVAGFAAKIVRMTSGTPGDTAKAIRDAAQRLGPYRYQRTRFGRPWDWRVGFGWIDRSIVAAWEPTGSGRDEDDPEPNAEGDQLTDTNDTTVCGTTDNTIMCGPDELLTNIVDDEATYLGKFTEAVRPLSDFLAALGSGSGYCCAMAAHFWRDPYRTAIIAGLPWEAAMLLGRGDWQAVYEAVDVELHRLEYPGGPGPIWVRAR
jgi:hypothetical protein